MAAGCDVSVFTGLRWSAATARRGIDLVELPGLDLPDGDDTDAGARLSARAARMTALLVPELSSRAIDLVVSDVITVAGGWAAEICGIPWIELSPHPLYAQSRGLPPIGAGLAGGTGVRGRLRDSAMRAASGRSVRQGERQRAQARATIGLAGHGSTPDARFIATLPALEVRRPDWPGNTHLIGPLLWEPTDAVFGRPAGREPLVVIAPSTAVTGVDMASAALAAMNPDLLEMTVRVVVSALEPPDGMASEVPDPARVVVGLARQDEILTQADLVICGGGHGMLAKSLLAGVPVVTIPGGGDQWELANRVSRQGAGLLVRPVTVEAVAEAARRVLTEPGFAVAATAAAASTAELTDPVAIVQRVLKASACASADRV